MIQMITRGLASVRQGLARSSFSSPYDRLPPLDRKIVDGLRTNGAVVSSISELLAADFTGVDRVMDLGNRLFENVEFSEQTDYLAGYANEDTTLDKSRYLQLIPRDRIDQFPELIAWGLQERLLDIVEAYLGLPAAYRGFAGRRDIANNVLTGTRFWHLDGEDTRIVKIIVYLSDVDIPEDGPFEFVPRPLLPPETPFPIFNGNRVRDEDLNARAPQEQHVLCTGKAGTVLFADPCTIWHRGAVGKRRDRKALFFAYNSRTPLAPVYCQSMFDTQRLASSVNLTPRQRGCLIF